MAYRNKKYNFIILLALFLVFIDCGKALEACSERLQDNLASEQDEKDTATSSSSYINVAAYLIPELTWEIGQTAPQPTDFFDASALGMVDGLREEETITFTFVTPITETMLHTKGKYIVELQCNGITIQGYLAIVDTTPPVIIVPEKLEYKVNEIILYKKNVEVLDNSGEVPKLIIDNLEVQPNMPGTYTVNYTAFDSAGNKGEAIVNIVIQAEHIATEEEMNGLADTLLSEIITEDMSQEEILWEIFDWCYHNIRYTPDANKSSVIQGAYEGIYYGTGDCFTYFATTAFLMDRSGIEYIPVSRAGERATHYWSLVKVRDGWYHFDCSPHKNGYLCFLQTDEQVRKYAEEYEGETDYFQFDEKGMPERSTHEIN